MSYSKAVKASASLASIKESQTVTQTLNPECKKISPTSMKSQLVNIHQEGHIDDNLELQESPSREV